MNKPEDLTLYYQSVEVNGAVHLLGNIAEQYRKEMETIDGAERAFARIHMFEAMVEFFGKFDRMRTDQVEFLKAQNIELMKHQPVAVRL